MDMLRRGWKMGLHAKYVITDSWFTCEQLMACVRSIAKGAMHFVGLAKMGKTKYTVSGRKKNAAELIATYERERGKNCRKYKCRYIQLSGHLGDIPVRIFLIKYGRNSAWNVLLTTDTTMSFVKTFFCVLIKVLTNLKHFQSMPHSHTILCWIYIVLLSSSDV